MGSFRTPLDIYPLLPRTNCGDCGLTSCLAFAAALLKEEKQAADCPHLAPEARARLEGGVVRQVNLERIQEEQLAGLRKTIRATDIFSRAPLLGGRIDGDRLSITCLGREFLIDRHGTVSSQCHTHAWFALPLLEYILKSEGIEPSGRWTLFPELPRGKTWAPLFGQRCEKPLKRIADGHSELFGDLVGMFGGTTSRPAMDADIGVLLHPFPKVPLLVCYWKPEDGMESKLRLFFDDTAERNLPAESLFTMATGIARMLERIMYAHSDGESRLS